jgi:hypothetical protein
MIGCVNGCVNLPNFAKSVSVLYARRCKQHANYERCKPGNWNT